MKRRRAILAAAGSLALAAACTRADFVITAVRTDLGAANTITTNGNGTIAGYYGMTRFYARNLGASGAVNQGSKLTSVSITMSDTGPGNLVVGGYNRASGTPQATDQADLFGQHEVSVANGAYIYKETLTTTNGAPKYVSFVNMLGDASVSTDNNVNQTLLSPAGFTPANAYSSYGYGIKSFSVDYSGINTGVDATIANGGLGALFAVAVAPITDSINLSGRLGGDMNPASTFAYNFTSSVIPGDVNLDGRVDMADALLLKANWGQTRTAWSQGEVNKDGVVNLADALIVGRNFGTVSGSIAPAALGEAAVPEPAGVMVIAGGLIALVRRRFT